MISPVENWLAKKTGLDGRLTPDTLLHWQLERAWESVAYAKKNSPFYADHLSAVQCGTTLSDWRELPLMDASAVLRDPKALLCVPQRDVARVVGVLSSGTSQQKHVFFSQADLDGTVDFFAHGMSTMTQKGQRVTVFMRGAEPYTVGDLLQKGLEHIGVGCTVAWPITHWEQAAQWAQGAHCLVGLPVFMLQLALRYPRLCPNAVLLSADYVPEAVIRRIEEIWHCLVFTHYGMTETGYGGGVQCIAGEGYHMRHADFLFEILHPQTRRPAEPGQLGEVVFTTLQKRAMPLIRYRTGDLAGWLDDCCPCGARLPRLSKVSGRLGSRPVPGTRSVNIHILDELLFDLKEIWDYRAAFDSVLRLQIYAPHGGRGQIEARIRQSVPDALVTFVDDFPPEFQKRQITPVL
jgi:phenylacetate-coenzyme A ligase PaaK-like adenylate-forming protein